MQRLFALFFLFMLPIAALAQNDRSLSPYFIVNVDSGTTLPQFPLRSTTADVIISGVIADVTVTQVYINHSDRVLEALYVFPGSTSAAVYAMEMQIGRRVIDAQIMKKDDARQVYETAKQAGKTTSLLEQQRPNVFTMNVANVMPGDSVIVRMSYTERLSPTDGVYEFVYPTVVAPRYTGEGAPVAGVGEGMAGEIPYTKKGVKPAYEFGINVSVGSGIPFEFIRSTSHKVLLSFEKGNTATVLLDKSETSGGDRDFILQYRFAGGKIETGLLLYEGKDENFFMLMVEPPKRVPLDSIPPREYIFVMDVSGSMGGYPLETSKKLLRNLVGGLRTSDKFNVIQFAGGGALFAQESVDATAANIDAAISFINHVQAGGGTELNNAMRMAMAVPKAEGFSRSIVILTDGLITAESRVLQSMREHLDSANVFAFGIGSSANRYLIEAMAYCGGGEPVVVTKSEEADSAAEKFRQYISSPVLSNVRIHYEGFDAYDVEPVAVPDLFASRPLVITGKYRGKAQGKISVTGTTGAGAYTKEIAVDSVRPRKQNKAIRLLWARDRIKYLSYLDRTGSYYYGIDTTVQNQITSLGLRYGLLTNYTSFVAVDRRVRNKDHEKDSIITQPLPLPARIENSAVGFTGTLQEVMIFSSVQGCVIPFLSLSVILPSRSTFPASAATAQAPATTGEVNRMYNGGFVNPVFSNYGQPFFTAGASGRMAAFLPVDMLGTYALGPYGVNGSLRSSQVNTGSLGFNTWLPVNGSQLQLSGTHFGTQDLYFMDNRKFGTRWQSQLEVSEQWKGTHTDRNADGYEDLPAGMHLHVHHRLGYEYTSPSMYHKRNLYNDLFFHAAWLNGGQLPEGAYSTHDQTMGFHMAPSAVIQAGDRKYLNVKASFAAASMDDRWAIDRFHLNTTQFTLAGDYEWSRERFTFHAGADGWISSGEERWNVQRFSAAHQSAGVYVSSFTERNGWLMNAALRTEINDVGGVAVLPLVRVSKNKGNFSFGTSASRYRDVPFGTGQLLPLFFSSRELSVASGVGLNQGWDFSAWLYFRKYNSRNWNAGVTYNLILPEHAVIIDVDADASRTLVYGADGGPLYHRAIFRLQGNLIRNLRMESEYVLTVTPFNYTGSDLQQPLQPLHRGYVSVAWKSLRNFNAALQLCYTGEQRIPQAGWSPDYATLNLLTNYTFRNDRFSVFANVFNIFDYRQRQFVMTTNGTFDGWKTWAPLAGRTFQAGVTVRF